LTLQSSQLSLLFKLFLLCLDNLYDIWVKHNVRKSWLIADIEVLYQNFIRNLLFSAL
jgi:hypothetical protein